MASNPAAPYLERRARNLEFFAKAFPGIHSYFKDYALKNLQLDIRPQDDEVDLIVSGRHVYGGHGKRYAREEAQRFNAHFPYGRAVRSVTPLGRGEYTHPRFFAERMKELYHYSPLELESFQGYLVPEFLPMVVCLGVGIGLHIWQLQEIREIHHLVIVEHDPDRFAASLYTVDWRRIVNRQHERSGRSIDFVLLHSVKEWQDVRASLWNKLIERCPIFPVNTFMYNHQADPKYDEVANGINRDIYVHLLSFGNYDDEVNQLNNAIHNFRNGIAKAGKTAAVNLTGLGKTGVCVVGAGPSLDNRIDELRQMSEKAVIFSCGTALGALLKHGIVPDVQIELESDYRTYLTQSQNADLEALRQVRILGAAQLSPKLFDLFGERRLFFKAESPLSSLFGDADERIVDAAPTCTNAALAIAAHYRFSHIFLFGLDYGFPSADQHHAKGTLYYEEGSTARVSKNLEQETIEVEAAAGGKILSTTFLYTSKRRTENVLVSATKNCAVLNFSDGARIERSEWVPPGKAQMFLEVLADCRPNFLAGVFNDNPVTIAATKVNQQTRALQIAVNDLCVKVSRILADPIPDLAQMTSVCFRINQYLQQKVLADSPSFYFFTRGSIWHFLHAGYSHAFAIAHTHDRKLWIEWWQDRFLYYLKFWPTHLASVLEKDFNAEDPWLELSIKNPEKFSIEELLPFQNLKWHSTGFNYTERGGFAFDSPQQDSVREFLP